MVTSPSGYGGDGVDLLYGGDGWNTLHGGRGNDQLPDEGSRSFLYGDGADDTLTGWYGRDSLYGGSGRDQLHGFWGRNTLQGDAGADILEGFAAQDTLEGGKGADQHFGGSGQGRVSGGAGNHEFVFEKPGPSGDIISDISNAKGDNDRIVIEAAGFGAGLVASERLSGAKFQAGDGHEPANSDVLFIFDTSDSSLWFNMDGQFKLIADLQYGAETTQHDNRLI